MKILKKELKHLAKEIRYWKFKRKLKNRGNSALWEIELKKNKLSYEFRHKHIAYCQMRGRLRYQIEQPAPNNLPDENYIEEIVHKYGKTLCIST